MTTPPELPADAKLRAYRAVFCLSGCFWIAVIAAVAWWNGWSVWPWSQF